MSFVYQKAREGFLTGAINWKDATDTMYAALISKANYAPIDATAASGDTLYATAIPSGDVFIEDVNLTVDTNGNGTATVTGGSTVFTAVSLLGDPTKTVDAVVIYQKNTDKLIAFIDTGLNLPVTPNGGDITIYWNNGSGEVFQL